MNSQTFKNYSFLKGYRSKAIIEVNKLYALAGLAVRSLDSLKEEIRLTKRRAVPIETVNRHGELIQTTKRKDKIWPIIDAAIDSGLYKTTLVGMVALTEDFLASYLKVFLTAHPLKISKDKKLAVTDLIEFSNIGEAIDALVDREILAALYKTPREYLEYFQQIISIKLTEQVVLDYIEIKATRDLLVHNSGTINSVYLEKAGQKARGAQGETILVGKEYFNKSVTTIKELIHFTFEKVLEKHGDSDEVARVGQSLQRPLPTEPLIVG